MGAVENAFKRISVEATWVARWPHNIPTRGGGSTLEDPHPDLQEQVHPGTNNQFLDTRAHAWSALCALTRSGGKWGIITVPAGVIEFVDREVDEPWTPNAPCEGMRRDVGTVDLGGPAM